MPMSKTYGVTKVKGKLQRKLAAIFKLQLALQQDAVLASSRALFNDRNEIVGPNGSVLVHGPYPHVEQPHPEGMSKDELTDLFLSLPKEYVDLVQRIDVNPVNGTHHTIRQISPTAVALAIYALPKAQRNADNVIASLKEFREYMADHQSKLVDETIDYMPFPKAKTIEIKIHHPHLNLQWRKGDTNRQYLDASAIEYSCSVPKPSDSRGKSWNSDTILDLKAMYLKDLSRVHKNTRNSRKRKALFVKIDNDYRAKIAGIFGIVL
jgi:hypothetical protein